MLRKKKKKWKGRIKSYRKERERKPRNNLWRYKKVYTVEVYFSSKKL